MTLRMIAATAALCLFACGTAAWAKEDPSLAGAEQTKRVSQKHKVRDHVAHRRSRSKRYASRHKSRRLATRTAVSRSTSGQVGARDFSGMASYYWEGSQVASGGRYNPDGMTAAHRTLPFGTRLQVTDLISKRSVVVTVNDRGPFIAGRVLDLSRGAATALGMTNRGVTPIKATVM
jgi:rare lipoprotein A